MKYVLNLIICFAFIMSLCGCSSTEITTELSSKETTYITQVTMTEPDNPETIECEEPVMKLFINDKEIPVKWENNDSVNEISEDVNNGEIIIEMSMYSNNEQVGSLGKEYSSSDNQTTTHNGDIVLYNSSNIVVFYGSNTWAYTRLGKMDLSEEEVVELLSNGDVTITIKR